MASASGNPLELVFGHVLDTFSEKNRPRKGGDGEKMAMTAPVRVEGSAPAGEKMAMTASVRVDSGKKKTKVSFVIGSKYSLKTVPKPMKIK